LSSCDATVTGHHVRSFEEKLRYMIKTLNVDIPKRDVKAFIRTRDSLAHEMQLRTTEKTDEYRMVMNVVDRLILGLLRYVGPYADCRTWQIVAGKPNLE
jgi:hypothetical protein